MNTPRSQFISDRNLKWSELRSDDGSFASIGDCVQYCLPNMRACASLFFGSKDGGDSMVEAFLIHILRQPLPSSELQTPSGLTLAFETFLRDQFENRPQRIALSSSPSAPSAVWMSVDEFFDTIARF